MRTIVLSLLLSLATLCLLVGCSKQKRQVVMTSAVRVAKDKKTMETWIRYRETHGAQNQFEVKAAERDGRLFIVEPGTRALVLGDAGTINGARLLRVGLLDGPNAGAEGVCFAAQTASP